MTSLAGHLLIAPPQERDVDFLRAVILMVQHSEEQAFGVVLNRPMNKTVGKVWKGKKRWECNQPAYSGGPVASPLMALHTDASIADLEVLPGVYYSIRQKLLDQLLHQPVGPFKIFISHVGWGPSQLERWIAARGWRTLPALPRHIFDTGTNLWEEVSKLVERNVEPGPC
jgi:putative transcriptional regulator